MSVKQDRAGVRTAADLERKYNFGKTFSEILGLIDDSRDKVDSAASELRNEIKEQATAIRRDTEGIVAEATEKIDGVSEKVAELELSADQFRVSVEEELDDIRNGVSVEIDADQLAIAVEKHLGEGVESVKTRTGYLFNAEGLTISQAGNEIENHINNSGMYVMRNGQEVLAADKDGVKALNLHTETYLTIGKGDGKCRFEDYGVSRVGCFWII